MGTRVVIVDDHPVVRDGLESLLRSLGLEVVASCPDGETALREVQLTRPDVVMMDLQMPGIGGLETIRRLGAAVPDASVLVLTMHDDDASLLAALRAGARGYLLKGATQAEISAAVDAVRSGQVVLGPGIARQVLALVGPAPPSGCSFPELSGRELAVLELVARGRRTADVAAQLHLSPKTVSNHLTTIFDKLQVTGRAEAIVLARERGLGR